MQTKTISQFTHFAILILISAQSYAKTKYRSVEPQSQQTSGIFFTENKGQVHDQFNKTRHDVLYGVMAGDVAVHIKRSGVSYQLYRTEKSVEINPAPSLTSNSKNHIQLGLTRQTIYRIDLSWKNYNINFTRSEENVRSGFSNYYSENCPQGALNVKSYSGITLHNLYQGINLHYYQMNGELKHDYIVAPHTDYQQIKVEVTGANISVKDDGSLLFNTSLGSIQEGAPVVYQNGKQLKARWTVMDNVLGFAIENYNPNFELVIDPVTRLWGTYYGGSSATTTGTDYASDCITDVNGNVFMSGHTGISGGTVIATVGSHQSSYSGGYDAFLVKFNNNGIRQWSTYYGGSGNELSYSCVTDASGNIYMTGQTSSTLSNVMSTSGTQQTTYGGGAYDAFLVKFNGNGVRQWGTYYGVSSDDYGQSCALDASGNIFLAGVSNSSSGLATSGSHQPSSGGGSWEAYLVKFNNSGIRQWATYYGSSGDDRAFTCATDNLGNIFIGGLTTSSVSIATPGAHQFTYGGGSDAFLIKFNNNGVRQWGTYYGGTNGETAWGCSTDASGNVYISGQTFSGTGTVIATAGAHQPNFGGGQSDAFLAKFNSSGNRQWSTYYGGATDEAGNSCVTDASGNVYLGGLSTSNGGTSIATAASHQTVNAGGNWDAMLVKFDANGIRQSGSYYGGSGAEYGGWCASTLTGEIYMTGYTSSNSGTVIATVASHQPNYGGSSFDAFLVKFDLCDAAPLQPLPLSSTVTCEGVTNIYSTALTNGAHSYTWTLPAGWSGSSNTNTISVTPGATGVFTLTASNYCGISQQLTVQITVHPNPTITLNNATLCAGQSLTLMASGAVNYTYSGGQVVAPNNTTSDTVTGTNSVGCYDTAVNTVTVYPLPLITTNSGAICLGESFTISPGGAVSYTYSSGPMVTPIVNTSYSVTGSSIQGCTNTAISNVTVHPLPNVSASSTPSMLCVGETATLSGQGATNYTFVPGGVGAIVQVSPVTTSNYTITGTDGNGCSNSSAFTLSVDECTELVEDLSLEFRTKIYPNPTKGKITLEVNSDYELRVMNTLGQIVYEVKLNNGKHELHLENLASGMYVAKFSDGKVSGTIKLIKE